MQFSTFKHLSEKYFKLQNEIAIELENLKENLKTDKEKLKTAKQIVNSKNLNEMHKQAIETDINLKCVLLPIVNKIIKCKKIEYALKTTSKNVNKRLNVYNLFNADFNLLQNKIETFLVENYIQYSKHQSEISTQYCTDICTQDGEMLNISLFNSNMQNEATKQVFKNIQDYFLKNSKTSEANFSFMQTLKKINPKYAEEVYEILWQSIKAYYNQINQEKIAKERKIILAAEHEIENLSSKTYIEKMIEKKKQEQEQLTENLKDVNWKILTDEKLKYNTARKQTIEDQLADVQKEILQLSNPEFIKMIININSQWIKNSNAKIEELNCKDFKID